MSLADAYAAAAELVRRFDPDRHVAALFAPADARPHLAALHAFALEIGRVRAAVREPAAGEIRLQWWADVLAGDRDGEAAANPIAAALLATLRERRLPVEPFAALVEARRFDLYDDLFPDWTALEGYLGETQSALLQLSALILGGEGRDTADAAGHAGVALGLASLLRAFPWHARRGQVMLPAPLLEAVGVSREDVTAGRDGEGLRAALGETRARARDHLAKARAALAAAPSAVLPAFLPLAVVPAYLDRMERRDYRPYADVIDLAQWRRIWLMWRFRR